METASTSPLSNPPAGIHRRRRRRVAVFAIVALAVGITAAALSAHGPRDRFRDRGFGGPEGMEDRIDFGVRWALDNVDATEDQKDKISDIFQKAAQDLRSVHDDQKEQRDAMREAVVALDGAKVEALRQASMARADQASKRLTQAFLEAAAILSPDQREELAELMERRHGHGGPFGGRGHFGGFGRFGGH
jgi:Spy/CpxP family protein refolding chaperone